MKIIVVGAGRTGQNIIKNLSDEEHEHEIIAVDIDGSLIQPLIEQYDINGVTGNGCFPHILLEAGAENTDMLIAVTAEDEINLLCCMVGKSLGIPHLIAHVRSPEYFSDFGTKGEELGINLFVNPEYTLASKIDRMLKAPKDVYLATFANGRLEIAEIPIVEDSPFVGKKLKELREGTKKDFLVVALTRGELAIVPDGDTVVQADDVLSVCAKHYELADIFSHFGLVKQKVKNVLIVGCHEDAFYLSDMLLDEGIGVKVIDDDMNICRDFKSHLPKADVICDDFTDKRVLDRESKAMDALIVMSKYDENNIVLAMYGKNRNIRRVVTVVRGDSYTGILDDIDLNALSPYELTGDLIATYVRSIDVPRGSQIVAMQTIAGGSAEALQFNIGKNPLLVGKSIREIRPRMIDGILFGAIIRGRQSIIPRGDTVLEEDDGIIVASLKNRITQIEDMFAES